MILQFQMKQYAEAVLVYHRCRFYAAHPIHHYRLYECYAQLGLYGNAVRHYDKAQNSTNRRIRTIAKSSGRQWKHVSVMWAMTRECVICGDDSLENVFICGGCLGESYCS